MFDLLIKKIAKKVEDNCCVYTIFAHIAAMKNRMDKQDEKIKELETEIRIYHRASHPGSDSSIYIKIVYKY